MSGYQPPRDPGSSLTLSGSLTAADGRPVAAHDVVLQRRGPHRWLRVAVATADASGAVSFSTPPADATATYRLVGAPGSAASLAHRARPARDSHLHGRRTGGST